MSRPTQEQLIDLYRITVDDYHFQVELSSSRAQYLLTFNAAVIAAGVALLQRAAGGTYGLVAAFFLLGILAALVGMASVQTNHSYYRFIRSTKLEIEKELGWDDRFFCRPTRGMRASPSAPKGGSRKRAALPERLMTFTNLLYCQFAVIAAIDFGAMLYSIAKL